MKPKPLRSVLYTPSAWGARFHSLKCFEALGAGAAGPGKTTIVLHNDIDQIHVEHNRCMLPQNHPDWIPTGGSTGWSLHLRRTVKMLEQTIVKSHRLFKVLDPGAKFDAQKTTWTFTSGFHYQFGHCKDSGSWQDYMSFEFTSINFDEAVQFEQNQYEQIKGRCRSSDHILRKMLRVRLMSNPQMRNEGEEFSFRGNINWLREYFVDPAPSGNTYLDREIVHPDGEIEVQTRIYLPATLDDNPDKDFVRQYRGRLLAMPEHHQRALLYGDWYATAGSFFGAVWKAQQHVIDAFKIPEEWIVFRSMDWGFVKPGCIGWFAMDHDDTLFLIREMKFQGKTDRQMCEEIKVVETEMGVWKGKRSLIRGPADNQLWERRGDSGKSKAEVFAENGIQWSKADKRSRRNNAEKLYKLLGDHQEGTKVPGILFFRNCSYVIKTIPQVQTMQGGRDDGEAPADGGDDHGLDMVLYAVAYASYGRTGLGATPKELDDWDEAGDRDEAEEDVDRGRDGYGSTL